MSIEAMKLPEHTITIHDHPEPQIMQWSDLELAAVKKYAEQYALRALSQQPATPEPVLFNGLTKAETEATASVIGLVSAPEPVKSFAELRAKHREGIDAEHAKLGATPEPVTVESVATVRRGKLSWLIEGGIAAIPDGVMLLIADSPITDDSGSGEVYTHPAPPVSDDVVRDAERWREVERASCDVTLRLHNTRRDLRSDVIDAAIAAKGN